MAKSGYKSLKDLNKALPSEVQEKYEIIGLEKRTTTAIFLPKFRKVNFSTLTLNKAEFLIKNGFPYLKKKTSKSKEKSGDS